MNANTALVVVCLYFAIGCYVALIASSFVHYRNGRDVWWWIKYSFLMVTMWPVFLRQWGR